MTDKAFKIEMEKYNFVSFNKIPESIDALENLANGLFVGAINKVTIRMKLCAFPLFSFVFNSKVYQLKSKNKLRTYFRHRRLIRKKQFELECQLHKGKFSRYACLP